MRAGAMSALTAACVVAHLGCGSSAASPAAGGDGGAIPLVDGGAGHDAGRDGSSPAPDGGVTIEGGAQGDGGGSGSVHVGADGDYSITFPNPAWTFLRA